MSARSEDLSKNIDTPPDYVPPEGKLGDVLFARLPHANVDSAESVREIREDG